MEQPNEKHLKLVKELAIAQEIINQKNKELVFWQKIYRESQKEIYKLEIEKAGIDKP